MTLSAVDGSPLEEHPPTNECPIPECLFCGERDCPLGDPLHYDKGGCPACYLAEREKESA